MPVILELGKLRQKDHKLESSFGYIVRPCLKDENRPNRVGELWEEQMSLGSRLTKRLIHSTVGIPHLPVCILGVGRNIHGIRASNSVRLGSKHLYPRSSLWS